MTSKLEIIGYSLQAQGIKGIKGNTCSCSCSCMLALPAQGSCWSKHCLLNWIATRVSFSGCFYHQ